MYLRMRSKVRIIFSPLVHESVRARRYGQRTVRASGRIFLPPRSIQHDPTTVYDTWSLTKESIMGIIAWIILGLGSGLLANLLILCRLNTRFGG
jgi:hypothetical protein